MIFFFFSYLPLDLLVSFTHLGLSIYNKIFRYLKSLITPCFSWLLSLKLEFYLNVVFISFSNWIFDTYGLSYKTAIILAL